jgi:hypothetical protein
MRFPGMVMGSAQKKQLAFSEHEADGRGANSCFSSIFFRWCTAFFNL